MRILSRLAVFSLALALGACATANDGAAKPSPVPSDRTQFGNYLSARLAASEQDLKGAARYYRAALAADPGNKDLLELAFFFSTSAGDIDDAAKLAERVVAAQPDDRAGRLALAVAAMRHRDYAGTRKQIGLSAKGPFGSVTVLLIDAWAAAGAGDKDVAIADLGALRAQGVADGLAMFHLALLADYTGNTQLADTSYLTALATTPTPRVIDAYGRFLERAGRKKEASDLYQKSLSQPGMEEIANQGLKRIKSGHRPDALVTRPEDGAAEALFGIASSLTDRSSTEVSILYLQLALSLRPKLDLGAVLLADRFETLGKYEDAIVAYRTIDENSPYWRLAAIEIALDEARLKHSDAAIAELTALTASRPDDSEAWTALGDTYRNAEKYKESVDAYDRALALRGGETSNDWSLFFSRAVAEQGVKDWDAAEADLKKALALSPNEPTLLNFLGYTWVDQGRNIPQALEMLEKAHALKPNDGYIADSVGWAYYKLGRYPDAARALEAAVELVPGDPTINDHYGDALWHVGRKREAQFQWNHALAFGPADADKAVIEKKLQDGLDGGAKPN